ncbi:P-type conjugative transfer protein TrbL [Rhizobium leguminosarum]|nr:P-type conjugative transfer protein TrbL [Rhizobium leguminosarum]
MVRRGRRRIVLGAGIAFLVFAAPALAQQGQVLTELENQVSTAAKGWETTVMDAAKSLFWILAGIEVGIAAVWLAIQAASLDSWFAELVRRIMFIGFFAFVLTQGPTFAKAVVDSLFQIGAGGGSASPAEVFDAGIRVASQMSEQAKFGVFEDNALAIAAVLAMGIVVICFSLVAAIFVSVMVEMYVGLLAGMIMLGLGGSSFTKDFAIRYLVYAFGVGMKLMALVMIAKIGSNVLLGLAQAPTAESDQFITTLAIAGISVVVFIIAMYVPHHPGCRTGSLRLRRHGDDPPWRPGGFVRSGRRVPRRRARCFEVWARASAPVPWLPDPPPRRRRSDHLALMPVPYLAWPTRSSIRQGAIRPLRRRLRKDRTNNSSRTGSHTWQGNPHLRTRTLPLGRNGQNVTAPT